MIRPAAVRRNKPVGKKPFFRFLLHPFFADAVIGLAVFGLIFALVFTAVSPERYELKAGDIPSEPIAAPRDVEDEKATLELMEPAYTRRDRKKTSVGVKPCCAARMPKAMPKGR